MSSEPLFAKTTAIFVSYAHEDEALRKELEKQLSFLRRQGAISEWYDRNIQAGQEWSDEIKRHLNTADIILLLISPDFLASDYCYSIEMQRAIERHDAKEARVIPIILRPVYWTDSPIGKLQALPPHGKPVTSWVNRDEAFLSIATGLREIIANLLLLSPSSPDLPHGHTSSITQSNYSSKEQEIRAKNVEEKSCANSDRTTSILHILSGFYQNMDKMYLSPNIPHNKLVSAKDVCNVSSDERVTGLVDCTLWGSGKSCILFGNHSMYFHGDFGASGIIPYIDFPSRVFRKARFIPGVITTNYGEKISVAGSNISASRFLSILQSIKCLEDVS